MTRTIKQNQPRTIVSDSDHHHRRHVSTTKMASLQRFKLLATQCGVTQSPTRSPRTSPVIHLRRRKSTLRTMLLGRRSSAGDYFRPSEKPIAKEEAEEKAMVVKRRNSLKELFVTSSPPPLEVEDRARRNEDLKSSVSSSSALVRVGLRIEPGLPRPVWSGFRYRSLLLRRAWRPVLVTIPE